jgi:hypothetical protein
VVTGLMLVNKKNSVESACPNKMCSSQSGVDDAAAGKTLMMVNTVGWIAGGVGLGVGAYLLLSAPRSRPAATWVPAASPQGASLSYVGTF